MALNSSNCASEIVTALENAGNLSGLDTAAKNKLTTDLGLFVGALFDHIVSNMEVVTTLDTSLNSIFTGGAPVPTDGGLALQTAWKTATVAGVADDASGTVA
jgi:hypothetical protein